MTQIQIPPTQILIKGAAAGRATKVRWHIFGIVFILVVINMVDRTALSIAMPSIAKEFALEPAMQGVILSAFFWSYAVMQVPAGWLIDRFGPRRLITAATIGWGFFQTAAGFATGGVSLLLLRIGLGAAEAPLFPAGAKLNAGWLSPKERARGAVLMDSGGPLGAACGGIVISWLILGLDSWKLAFVVAGIATIAIGCVSWRYIRDNPASHPGVNQAELALINDGRSTDVAADDGDGQEVSRRSLGAVLLGRMGWAMINFGLLTWGPTYLAQAHGFDLKQMGGATFAIFIAGMFGSLVSGFLADKLVSSGYRRSTVYKSLLIVSGLCVCTGFVGLPHVASAIPAVALLSATVFFLYFGSLYWTLPALLAPRSSVGIIGGLMNFAGSASGIAVPILAGLILQWTMGSFQTVLLFFSACALVYVIGTALIDLKRTDDERG